MAAAVTLGDLDWMVDVLRGRRRALAPYAPVFCRPARDADTRHRAYLHHILTEDGARLAYAELTAGRGSAREG